MHRVSPDPERLEDAVVFPSCFLFLWLIVFLFLLDVFVGCFPGDRNGKQMLAATA